MKNILLLILFLNTLSAFAQSKISYSFEVKISDAWTDWAEEEVVLKNEGWKITKKEGNRVYIQSAKDFPISNFPFYLSVADFEIKISNWNGDYYLAMNYIYGDYDISATSSSKLTTLDKNVLSLRGGDHASGTWSINAKAEIAFHD